MHLPFSENFIEGYRGGIKLQPAPNDDLILNNKLRTSLSEVMNQPYCVYLLNTQSAMLEMNDQTLIFCGFDSPVQARGKTMVDIAPHETAKKVISIHKRVLQSKNKTIAEEEILTNEKIDQCLTTVIPWYNQDNKIAGVLGCTIILGVHALADSLTKMSKLGLLDASMQPKSIFPTLDSSMYFSKRETQCLNLLTQGKTAKEIALQLNLSYRTVEHYIDNIKNKMGVSSKSELIIKIFNL